MSSMMGVYQLAVKRYILGVCCGVCVVKGLVCCSVVTPHCADLSSTAGKDSISSLQLRYYSLIPPSDFTSTTPPPTHRHMHTCTYYTFLTVSSLTSDACQTKLR